MGQIDEKIAAMGIVLPDPLVLPGVNRTAAVLIGNILYLSGHGASLLTWSRGLLRAAHSGSMPSARLKDVASSGRKSYRPLTPHAPAMDRAGCADCFQSVRASIAARWAPAE